MNLQNTRVWLVAAMLFSLFIAGVSIAADFRLIPTQVRGIPYFDKMGHFVLFGILAFFLHLALGGRALTLGRVRVPAAFLIVVAFTLLDEWQQSLSPYRAVDPADLAADWVGIALGVWLADKLTHLQRFTKRTNATQK